MAFLSEAAVEQALLDQLPNASLCWSQQSPSTISTCCTVLCVLPTLGRQCAKRKGGRENSRKSLIYKGWTCGHGVLLSMGNGE